MSVFEWPHLRDNTVFLNIQCMFLSLKIECRLKCASLSDRMPAVIGNFISRHVYSSRLSTHHRIVTPNCCRFVDVRHGKEAKTGHSWTVRSLLEHGPLFMLKSTYCLEPSRNQLCSPCGQAVPPGGKKVQDHHPI